MSCMEVNIEVGDKHAIYGLPSNVAYYLRKVYKIIIFFIFF